MGIIQLKLIQNLVVVKLSDSSFTFYVNVNGLMLAAEEEKFKTIKSKNLRHIFHNLS